MSNDSRLQQYVPDWLWSKTTTVRGVIALTRKQDLTHTAAGVAYYTFVATIPLLLLVVAVTSVLGGEALVDHVTGLIGQQLSPSGQQLVAETLMDNTGRGTASLLGVLILTWNGLRVFRGLKHGVERMYPDAPESSLREEFRDAIVVAAGLFAAGTLVVAISVLLSVSPQAVPAGDAVGKATLVVVLIGILLPIYYVLPPVETSVSGVLAGTAVAAVGWVALQTGFQVYVGSAGQYGAYGVIGALLLFVTFVYFASIIVLLGAAVNAVRNGGSTGTQ